MPTQNFISSKNILKECIGFQNIPKRKETQEYSHCQHTCPKSMAKVSCSNRKERIKAEILEHYQEGRKNTGVKVLVNTVDFPSQIF